MEEGLDERRLVTTVVIAIWIIFICNLKENERVIL